MKKLTNKKVDEILKIYPEYKTVYGPYCRKDGRDIVILYDGNKRSARQLARVLLEIHIGRRLGENETVDHINENFSDHRIKNLRILTREENARRSAIGNKYCLGLKQKDEDKRNGEKNGLAMMSNKDVEEYRKGYSCGKYSREDISEIVGCNDRSVRNMLSGKTYVEAGGPLAFFKIGRPK